MYKNSEEKNFSRH